MKGPGGMSVHRLSVAAAVLALCETAWALYCAETGVNLGVFYAILIAASAVFWVPGVLEKRGQ